MAKAHDIFLSYSGIDRKKIIPLIKAFESKGWAVWWDQEIPTGRTFDEYIEEILGLSKVVVVVWSKYSVKSRWVRTEANEGLKREVLFPLKIEAVEPPIAFRLVQTADFSNWDEAVLNAFLKNIEQKLRGRHKEIPKIYSYKQKHSFSKYLSFAGLFVLVTLLSWYIISDNGSSKTDPNTDNNHIAQPQQLEIQTPKDTVELVQKPVIDYGSIKDRSGIIYRTVTLNGKTWLADNLSLMVDGSWCFAETSSNCRKFGRLYNWDAALASCKLLGRNWRLPTDREWKDLADYFVDSPYWTPSDDIVDGKAAYEALIKGGRSGFDAVHGGELSAGGTSFRGVNHYGIYWSSTENEEEDFQAWTYYFLASSNRLYRYGTFFKPSGFSCRCIKD